MRNSASQGRHLDQTQWRGNAAGRLDPGVHCFGMLMDGRSQAHGLHERGTDTTLLIVFNSHHEPADFALPECNGARAGDCCSIQRSGDTDTDRDRARRRFGCAQLLTDAWIARCRYSNGCRIPNDATPAPHRHPRARDALRRRTAVRWQRALPNLGAEARAVGLRIEGHDTGLALQREAGGWHSLTDAFMHPGTRYQFLLPDGSAVPDPASRFQPEDVHGPKRSDRSAGLSLA